MSDPVITVAARAWCVPLLAPRQNRIVVPGLLKLGRQPAKDYDALHDVVFAALTRAYPTLDRDEFDDWPIPVYEPLDALPVIATQTGMLRQARGAALATAPDWDAIIAQFANFLPGTTPDYWEDALTIPRLEAMYEEWREHPPLAMLAAGWLGYKPRPREEDALEELMHWFPNGRLRLS